MKVFEIYIAEADGATRKFLTHHEKTKKEFLEDIETYSKITCKKIVETNKEENIEKRHYISATDILNSTISYLISNAGYSLLVFEAEVRFSDESYFINNKNTCLKNIIGNDIINEIATLNDTLNCHWNFDLEYDCLCEETKFLSGGFQDTTSYQIILEFGKAAIPKLFEKLKEDSAFHPVIHLLCELIEKEKLPVIPENSRGKSDDIKKIFLEWWQENKTKI